MNDALHGRFIVQRDRCRCAPGDAVHAVRHDQREALLTQFRGLLRFGLVQRMRAGISAERGVPMASSPVLRLALLGRARGQSQIAVRFDQRRPDMQPIEVADDGTRRDAHLLTGSQHLAIADEQSGLLEGRARIGVKGGVREGEDRGGGIAHVRWRWRALPEAERGKEDQREWRETHAARRMYDRPHGMKGLNGRSRYTSPANRTPPRAIASSSAASIPNGSRRGSAGTAIRCPCSGRR